MYSLPSNSLQSFVYKGSLHFGMQFIDQDEVADMSTRQTSVGEAADLRPEVGLVAGMAMTTSYTLADYQILGETVEKTYTSLIDTINEKGLTFNGKLYTNKVFKTGTDIDNQPRFLFGDLVNDTNVDIRTGMEVVNIRKTEEEGVVPNAVLVKPVDGETRTWIYADHIILAAGALNSARLALNAGIAEPTGQDENGRDYLGPLWDHQGMVVTYFAPGTKFPEEGAASEIQEEYSTGLGLPVFADLEAARGNNTQAGFLATMSIPILQSQAEIDNLVAGTWSAADPVGTETYSYVFDLGTFFAAGHPGGNQESAIAENNFDIGLVLDTVAPETHRTNKLQRLGRAGATLIGILDQAGGTIEYDYSQVNLAGDTLIGHLQSVSWMYGHGNYEIAFLSGESTIDTSLWLHQQFQQLSYFCLHSVLTIRHGSTTIPQFPDQI
jgi:hypothetical protein